MRQTHISNKRAKQLFEAIVRNCVQMGSTTIRGSHYSNFYYVGRNKSYNVQVDRRNNTIVKHISVYSKHGVHVKQYYNKDQWEISHDTD